MGGDSYPQVWRIFCAKRILGKNAGGGAGFIDMASPEVFLTDFLTAFPRWKDIDPRAPPPRAPPYFDRSAALMRPFRTPFTLGSERNTWWALRLTAVRPKVKNGPPEIPRPAPPPFNGGDIGG